MKESEFEGLMTTYAESLGTCSRLPSRRARTIRWRGPAVAAACLALGGIGLTVIWPRNAAAASVHRIGAAIHNARSMVVEYSLQTPAGRWRVFDRVSYQAGLWRYDIEKSVPLSLTLIKRDGSTIRDWKQLDHAVRRPTQPSDPDTKGYRDPLEYAEESLTMGLNSPPVLRVRDHENINGSPAYAVTLDRAADDYHAEIIVDRRTDLPISAAATVKSRDRVLRYRQAYRFNEPLADSLFEPNPDRTIIDLPDAERKLASSWSTALAQVGATDVHDARVSRDGTIWIAVAVVAGQPTCALPTTIRSSNGAEYARLRDAEPSEIIVNDRPFQVGGKAVVVVGFTPLKKIDVLPTEAIVSFAMREPLAPAPLQQEGVRQAIPHSQVRLALRDEQGEYPSYFVALDLDRLALELPIDVPDARALALERLGRTLEAARAYEDEARGNERFVPHHAAVPLAKAERCYRAVGMTAEADRVRAWAESVTAAN